MVEDEAVQRLRQLFCPAHAMLPVALAAGVGWYGLSALHRMSQDAKVPPENSSQDPAVKEPFQGAIAHINTRTFSDTSRFVSVTEDVDVQGARIFFVDYGNGQRVQQYVDPRIWL